MEEQELLNTQEKEKKRAKLAEFSLDILRGALIGIAFIIPGFSGGSIMAILGIYEKFVGAVADIFKDFKRSFLTILPIAIGLVLGAVALLFPLGWALEAFPIPTVSLFVGLALGGLPSITDKIHGRFKPLNLLSLFVPLAVAVSLSFLPTAGDVDLFDLNFGGYALLFLIGMLGSIALVVPGISGSMILLILGYYNPIVQMITGHLFRLRNVGTCLLVLGVTGVGILLGFFLVSVLMRWLLRTCPRGTYFAIVGFVVGSLPTVFIATAKDAGSTLLALLATPWDWVASVLLLLIGFAGAFAFVKYAQKREKKRKVSLVVTQENSDNQEEN